MKFLLTVSLVICLAYAHFLPRRNDSSEVSERRQKRRDFFKNFTRNMTNVEDKMERLNQRIKARLNKEADPIQQKEMTEALKGYRRKDRVRINTKGDDIVDINNNENISSVMYQTDIIFTEDQVEMLLNETETRSKRQAYKDRFFPRYLWANNIVNYYFDGSATASMKKVFKAAADIWSKNTCISFVESTTAANRIKVFLGQGCYSYIGMIGGVQELSLGTGCDMIGIAAHEIGHALGFFHTQSRYDRDSFITVNINNIRASFVDQFDKETESTNNNYGMTYDYGSVMHYSATSSSSNGNPTMVAKDIKYQDTMGSHNVAFYDISMINSHYSCKSKCATNKCSNGGFPNPKNCNTCICPSGYGGTLCTARPAGCGSVLNATTTAKTVAATAGQSGMTDDFFFCNYWIQAPAGSRIEVTLSSYSGATSSGCAYAGVEIKTHADQKRTGYRYCSNEDKGTILTSTGNLVPVIAYSRYYVTNASLKYRIVSTATQVTIPEATAAPTNCFDKSSSCLNWAKNGFCTNGFYSADYVKSYCASTCKKC